MNANLASPFDNLSNNRFSWLSLQGGLASVLMLIFLAACNPSLTPDPTFPISDAPIEIIPVTPGKLADPASLPYDKPVNCPGLDSLLYQLTQSADPFSAAQQSGLRINNGKVQVLFDLASADSTFLSEYGVEIGSQSGNQVQGFVPLDRLCELANLDQVLAIRPPAMAIFP
ncbi:MAG: hypothetical protein R6V73_12935 [Anaerolineales bacterium]